MSFCVVKIHMGTEGPDFFLWQKKGNCLECSLLNKILFHLVTISSGLSSPAAASYEKRSSIHEVKNNSSGEPCHECYGWSSWQALIVFHLQRVTLCSTVLACLEHEGFIQTLILLELFVVLLYKGDMAWAFFRVRKQDLQNSAQGT